MSLSGCSSTPIQQGFQKPNPPLERTQIPPRSTASDATLETESIAEIPEEEISDPCDEKSFPSLPALSCSTPEAGNLQLLFVEAETALYTRYAISYDSEGLSLSGVMLIPKGEGPFPLVLTNHGYIATSVYTRGRGLKREQAALAENGFAVIHPDYRNHAESDKDPDNTLNFRIGYAQDVIGAIVAAQKSELPELQSVDTSRVGMIGHSMGGGVSMQVAVAKPELVDAVMLYAPVSSKSEENLQRYFLRNNRRSEDVVQLFETYGEPENSPEFWDQLSAYEYFDQIDDPVQIFIGTADDSVDPQWSYDIQSRLEALNKDVELIEYPNAPHEFIRNFPDFRENFLRFFGENL
jgi:dipeptidyl aminopeptidase/acylaminoacyl peptidase